MGDEATIYIFSGNEGRGCGPLMNAVMDRYGVNTVPESFPLTPWRGHVSRRAAFLPMRTWALVHFDDTHAVFVRRIPAHAVLIAERE